MLIILSAVVAVQGLAAVSQSQVPTRDVIPAVAPGLAAQSLPVVIVAGERRTLDLRTAAR
jgi:hypothetical protein